MGGSLMIDAIVDIDRMSLDKNEIPTKLRPIRVTPLRKNTDREDLIYYRPMLITNHIMEIIERMISD